MKWDDPRRHRLGLRARPPRRWPWILLVLGLAAVYISLWIWASQPP